MLRWFARRQASAGRRFLSAVKHPHYLKTIRHCSTLSSNNFVDQPSGSESTSITVDRSELYNPPAHSHEHGCESELVKHLRTIIKFRGGPISVAEYMEEVLTNPKAGYYINRDVFGSGGDFITSPEVSQMFGEMIGVWAITLWEQMGQPKKLNLVELGPGRGTLIADLLRGVSKFKAFIESLSVHLIECSPTLQKLQRAKLKFIEDDNIIPISWHTSLDEVPSGTPSIIIGHEFFDALPVHQFQKTSRGWCEKMVDVCEEGNNFRFVLSYGPNPASLYLMKRMKWMKKEEVENLKEIEISSKAMDLTTEIAKRVSADGGGALIIDYGVNGVVSESVQAIRDHKFVDVLDGPGTADLSAYVDFEAVRKCAEEAGNVGVYGPITQSQFLGGLGINFRVEALMQSCTEEQAESMQIGYWKLVGDGEAPFWEGADDRTPVGMGSRYLVMAIVNHKCGAPVPFH